jgi:hypothetical protein
MGKTLGEETVVDTTQRLSGSNDPTIGNDEETLRGTNWSVHQCEIDFFGARGRHDVGDQYWLINAFGGSLWVQVDPASMMPEIRNCIAQDAAEGNADKIAQVQLGPRQAVVFFLEGRLTVAHLKQAIEPEDGAFIDIPKVAVEERVVTIRVIGAPRHTVATADQDGNVL